jgi:hypothetical protein
MDETSVLGRGVDREILRDIGERISSITPGDYTSSERRGEQEGGYFRRAMQSTIVRYGAVAMLAFGIGMAGKENFKQSYQASVAAAKSGVGYVTQKLFNAMPQEQRDKILRESTNPEKQKAEQGKSVIDKVKEYGNKLTEKEEQVVPGLKKVNDAVLKLYGAQRPEKK